MKSLFRNFLMLAAVLSVGFLFSCGDDEETPEAVAAPAITVVGSTGSTQADASVLVSDGEVIAGDSVFFTVNVTAEGGFNTLSLSGDATGQVTRTDLNIDKGTTTTGALVFGIQTLATQEGESKTVTFTAADDQEPSLSTVVEFSFDIVAPASPEARSYSAILLAAPLGDETANKTSETFFSTNTGETYSMNEVLTTSDPISADIDFGYFYGSGTGGTEATLSDPASYPFEYGQAGWGTRNATVFRRTSLDATAFIEVTTYADIDAEYDAATAADSDSGIESGLVAGEVLAFATDASKTGGSKKGLILIKSIVDGDGADGQISIDILVQEETN